MSVQDTETVPSPKRSKPTGADMVIDLLRRSETSLTIHEIADGVRIPRLITSGIIDRLVVRRLLKRTGVNSAGRIVFGLTDK